MHSSGCCSSVLDFRPSIDFSLRASSRGQRRSFACEPTWTTVRTFQFTRRRCSTVPGSPPSAILARTPRGRPLARPSADPTVKEPVRLHFAALHPGPESVRNLRLSPAFRGCVRPRSHADQVSIFAARLGFALEGSPSSAGSKRTRRGLWSISLFFPAIGTSRSTTGGLAPSTGRLCQSSF